MSIKVKTTQWQVITGAPCSGKTTLINELIHLGYKTAPEVARQFLSRLLEYADRKKLEDNMTAVQESILMWERTREKFFEAEEVIFLDRALPDSLAYYWLNNLTAEKVHQACREVRYQRVFYCEPLPLQKDTIRHETPEQALEIAKNIQRAYQEVGYELIHVPVMPIKERVAFVLAALT